MATQEIVYRISADNKQAVQAFNELAKAQNIATQSTRTLQANSQQSNMLLMNTGRIVQDLPFGIMGVGNNITFLAEQFGQAKAQGIGFKDSLKGMLSALAGPGGLIFGISTFVTIMTMMNRNTKTGDSYTQDFIDTMIKGSSESEQYAKSIGMVTKALQGLTDETLKSRITELTNEANSLWRGLTRIFNPSGFGQTLFALKQALTEKEQRDLRESLGLGGTEQGLIQRLQMQIQLNAELRDGAQTLEEQTKYQKIINQLQGELNSQLGVTKSHLKDIKETIKEITGGRAETVNRQSTSMQSSIFRSLGGAGIDRGGGRAGGARITEGFAEQMMFIQSQIRETASLLSSEFKTAWQDIFGEANSLFEKFMLNIASSLAELAAQNLLSGFLNMILPGAGGLAAMATGSTRNPNVINLQVENRTLASFYVNGKNEATRLRMD